MPGTKGNKNAVGNSGGKSLQDRQLAARVRSLALKEIERVLKSDDDEEFRKALLLKLATGILPRLNEHSGPDGEELNVGVVMLPTKNASPLAASTEAGSRSR